MNLPFQHTSLLFFLFCFKKIKNLEQYKRDDVILKTFLAKLVKKKQKIKMGNMNANDSGHTEPLYDISAMLLIGGVEEDSLEKVKSVFESNPINVHLLQAKLFEDEMTAIEFAKKNDQEQIFKYLESVEEQWHNFRIHQKEEPAFVFIDPQLTNNDFNFQCDESVGEQELEGIANFLSNLSVSENGK